MPVKGPPQAAGTVRSSSRDRGGAETRQRMIEGAKRLIAERGYKDTTMKAIAESAGVTEPAVYRHFESKAQLMVTVFSEVASALPLFKVDSEKDNVADIIAESAGKVTDPNVAIFRRLTVEMYAAAALDKDVNALVEGFTEMGAARLRAQIEAGIEAGDLPADTDVVFTQWLVHILMLGLCNHETIGAHLIGNEAWRQFVAKATRRLLTG